VSSSWLVSLRTSGPRCSPTLTPMETTDMFDPDFTEQTELPGEMLDEVMDLLYGDFGDSLLPDSEMEKYDWPEAPSGAADRA